MDDGQQLRAALIEAAASDDDLRLAQLCVAHQATIPLEFLAWTKVPFELRADPQAVQRYAQALIRVANVFAMRLRIPPCSTRCRDRRSRTRSPRGRAPSARLGS